MSANRTIYFTIERVSSADQSPLLGNEGTEEGEGDETTNNKSVTANQARATAS